MSILARPLERAKQLGINPNDPCDEAGMVFILKKIAAANRLVYEPGMAQEWLEAMQVWCLKRRRAPFSFMELLAAAVDLAATSGTAFTQPAELFKTVGAVQAARYRQALNGQNTIPLPPGTDTAWTLQQRQAYERAWKQSALTGITNPNRLQENALKIAGLEPPKQLQPTQTNLKQLIDATAKGKTQNG